MKYRISVSVATSLFVMLPLSGAMARPPQSNNLLAKETARNRVIITDFVRLLFIEHNAKAAYETHVVANFIEHNPDLTDGRDAAIGMLTKVFGNPDVRFDIKRIVVDGDLAVIHVHGRRDPKTSGIAVVNIYRLKNGKIVEHWGVAQPVPEKSANPHPMF